MIGPYRTVTRSSAAAAGAAQTSSPNTAATIASLPTPSRDIAPKYAAREQGRDQLAFSAASWVGSGISIGPSFGVPIRRWLPNGSRSPQSVP